jgi:hypothetical protein
MEIEYLNTDLQIESLADLTIIVEELGEEMFVLFNGQARGYNMVSFETNDSHSSADETINHFCLLIENLSPQARIVWDGCVVREFDIGYQGGDSGNSFRSELRAMTVKRVAALDAHITVTIYPAYLAGEMEKRGSRKPL